MAETKSTNQMRVGVAIVIALVLTFIGVSQLTNNEQTTTGNEKQENAQVEQQETNQESDNAVTVNEDGTIVGYLGETGKSALELLKEKIETKTEESSFGEYVTAIGDVPSTDSKFWIFYVNDVTATVGAADYVTMDGDKIEWRLE